MPDPSLNPTNLIYRFADFELDTASARLATLAQERDQGAGETPGGGANHQRTRVEVEIADLQLRLLELLLAKPGEVQSRGFLQDALWGAGTHLEADNSLNAAVSRLRDCLGDSASEPRLIETVPKRGYRFVADVEILRTPGALDQPDPKPGKVSIASSKRPAPSPRSPSPRALTWAGLIATVLAALWLTVRYFENSSNSPSNSAVNRKAETVSSHEANSNSPGGKTKALEPDLARAREFASWGTHQGLERAIATYVGALAEDNRSQPERTAQIFAGLALCYLDLAEYDYWRPIEAYEAARSAIDRALLEDKHSAAALLANSKHLAVAQWRWGEALEQVELALTKDPGLTDAALFRAALLSSFARHQEALEEMQAALAADSTSSELNANYAWLLFHADRFDQAIEQSRKTIALAPRHADAYDDLKWIYLTAGETELAVSVWETMIEIVEGEGQGFREHVDHSGLEAVLEESVAGRLARAAEPGYQPPYDLVLDLVLLGELDEALRWLERSLNERETDIASLAVDPRLDPLRSSAGFGELMERVGLPSR